MARQMGKKIRAESVNNSVSELTKKKNKGEADFNSFSGGEETRAESLEQISLFSSLSPSSLQKLEESCRWHEFREGDKVVQKGEDGREVYFITSGNAHVLNFASSGRVIDFASLGPGDFFGELAAIDARPRSATVVAKTPCRMASLEHQDFMELVTSYPEITTTVLNRLATVVRMVDERITDISVLDAEQRVCVELLRLAIPDPAYFDNYNHLVVYPVPTQKKLANSIGVARETVARIFGRLSGEGVIERKEKTIYIRDISALEALALPFND